MNAVFADSSYLLAIVSPKDQNHVRAKSFDGRYQSLVSTQFVLMEVAAALARSKDKNLFLQLLGTLEHDPNVEIMPAGDALFHDGVGLYRQRLDKDWSLTDCISFVVMQQKGIREALTADHHFEQAGFVALLK